ncbi:MAG: response regulator [Marinilabiliales bacterium]|nr:MAG: response regulator [Marinilabiliales bacterium]
MKGNRSGKLVYVVDDDLPSYQLIEELLSGKRIALKHFTNGVDLLDAFSSGKKPELVIMDIQLPGTDGLELTRKIKAMGDNIPVIAYTSYAMAGDKDRCLEAGCDEYVSKPVDLKHFAALVSHYLDG